MGPSVLIREVSFLKKHFCTHLYVAEAATTAHITEPEFRVYHPISVGPMYNCHTKDVLQTGEEAAAKVIVGEPWMHKNETHVHAYMMKT